MGLRCADCTAHAAETDVVKARPVQYSTPYSVENRTVGAIAPGTNDRARVLHRASAVLSACTHSGGARREAG